MRLQRHTEDGGPEACRSAKPGEDFDRDALGDGQQRVSERQRLYCSDNLQGLRS